MRPSGRQVFLLDGLGGVLTATLLGLVLPMFFEHIGLGPWTLRWLGFGGFCCALFSLSTYLRAPARLPAYLRVIIVANLAYCLVTVTLLALHRTELTSLGSAYFIVELAVILALVVLEIRALRRFELK
ncbi:MAG: hypothetical protein KF813_11155 [Trueperaceae bacterium]|nr:hypothetical protein [Trueperaceae bacterium]